MGNELGFLTVVLIPVILYYIGYALAEAHPQQPPAKTPLHYRVITQVLLTLGLVLFVPLWITAFSVFTEVTRPTSWLITCLFLAIASFGASSVSNNNIYSHIGLLAVTGFVASVARLFRATPALTLLICFILLLILELPLIFQKYLTNNPEKRLMGKKSPAQSTAKQPEIHSASQKFQKFLVRPIQNYLAIAPIATLLLSLVFPANYAASSHYLAYLSAAAVLCYATQYIIHQETTTQILLRITLHAFLLTFAADLAGSIDTVYVMIWIAAAVFQAGVTILSALRSTDPDPLILNVEGAAITTLLLISFFLTNLIESWPVAVLLQSVSAVSLALFSSALYKINHSAPWLYLPLLPLYAAPLILSGKLILSSSTLGPEVPLPTFLPYYILLTLAIIFLSDQFAKTRQKLFPSLTPIYFCLGLGVVGTVTCTLPGQNYLGILFAAAEILTANYLLRPPLNVGPIGYLLIILASLDYAKVIAETIGLSSAALVIPVISIWLLIGLKNKKFAQIFATFKNHQPTLTEGLDIDEKLKNSAPRCYNATEN